MQYNKDITSEHKELFLKVRAVICAFEGVIETKKERITTYSNAGGGICHMRTMPYGIDIGFLKGARMKDDFMVLQGNGKAMRVLPLEKMETKLIKHYMHQAIKLNFKN